MVWIRTICAGGALLLAACTPPKLGEAPRLMPVEQLDSAQSFADNVAAWPEGQWWRAYGDPQLDALIDQALAGSPDVRAATARIREAMGSAQVAYARMTPSLSVTGSATVEKQSYNLGFPREFLPQGWNDVGKATTGLEFNLDLWGRNRAALAAARGEVAATRVEADQVRLMLSTAIATDYATLNGLHLQRDVAERAIAIRQTSLELTAERARMGLDNQGPVETARSRLPAARENLAQIDEAIALVRNRLAALTGAGPDRGLSITRPAVQGLRAQGLPENLPLNLLGRRPDLAAARLRAEAAAQRVHAAKAAFYPDVNLVGLIGVNSLGLNNLTDAGSTYGSIGPAVTVPIFGVQRLQGRYRSARASYDGAVADYDSTLVAALHDVADVAASTRALARRHSESAQSLAAAERAYAITQARFKGGLATYLDALNAEDTLLERRSLHAALEARAFMLDVALVRALGGGFGAQDASNGDQARG